MGPGVRFLLILSILVVFVLVPAGIVFYQGLKWAMLWLTDGATLLPYPTPK